MRRLLVMPLLLVPFAVMLLAQPIRQSKTLTIYELPKSLPTQPPTPHIRSLLHQLASPNPDTHASAERALLALCPQIEPQLRYAVAEEEKSAPAPLPKSAPRTQDYVRGGAFGRVEPADLLPRPAFHSLEVLLERSAERRHAQPALITLHATNAPLTDVLRQLGQQADASVTAQAESFDGAVNPAALDWLQHATITLRLDRVPYWKALRTLLAAIHPPELLSVNLFLIIGSNHIHLTPLAKNAYDIFRDPAAISAGPMLLSARYQLTPQPRVFVSAVVDPALTSFTGDSALHLDSFTDNHGQSLLPEAANTTTSGGLEDKDFIPGIGYAFEPADGEIGWRQPLPIRTPQDGSSIASIRGIFRIGFGSTGPFGYTTHGIGIPLAPFHLQSLVPPPAEEPIYLLEDCKALQPPSVDNPVYVKDHLDCSARGIDHTVGRHTVEGVTLTLTNHRDHPVTYITSLTYFDHPAANFPRPDQIADFVGIYRTHADPGQTVRVRMAHQYHEGDRAPRPALPGTLPAPSSNTPSQTVVYDGWRLTVLSVTRDGEIWHIAGQLTLPALGPFADSEVGAGYIYLSPLDAQGWTIESYPHFSKLRPQADTLIEDFSVTTREPGRIPSVLLWQTPAATHWLEAPFHIEHFTPFTPPTP